MCLYNISFFEMNARHKTKQDYTFFFVQFS